MTFLKNSWYVGAWADEVGPDTILPRRILGEQIIFFRTEEGPAALIDRCPHRFAPLSLGKRVGNVVQCGYHGLLFDGKGTCVHNPHGQVPSGKAKSFPVAEKYNAIWIWMGDEQPDESLIPDLSKIFVPNVSEFHTLFTVRGNYNLVADNLLDIPHAIYLHSGVLATEEMIEALKIDTTQSDDAVYINMIAPNVAPPGFQKPYLAEEMTSVDFFVDVRWTPAANLLLHIGATPPGQPKGAPGGTYGYAAHLLTPETEKSTHYFFIGSRDRQLTENQYDWWTKALINAFVNEDEPMIHAQQDVIGDADLLSMKPSLISTDAGIVKMRRVLKGLIAKERNELVTED